MATAGLDNIVMSPHRAGSVGAGPSRCELERKGSLRQVAKRELLCSCRSGVIKEAARSPCDRALSHGSFGRAIQHCCGERIRGDAQQSPFCSMNVVGLSACCTSTDMTSLLLVCCHCLSRRSVE